MINIEPDEKIVFVVRKHWYIYAAEATVIILVAIAPLLLIEIVSQLFSLNMPEKSPAYIIFFYSIWLALLWMFFFIMWTNHHLDAWIITNKRIVDIEQIGLFNREVTSFRFDKIQDVTVETRGILATMLKFGTLHVQTAGENQEIAMSHISNPDNVKEIIMRQQISVVNSKNPII